MKIGLVLPSIPAYSETFFRNKIEGLQRHGITVVLFVNTSSKNKDYLNCEIVFAPKLNGSNIQIVFNTLLQLCKVVFLHPKKSFLLYKANQKDRVSFNANLKSVIANQFLLSQKLDWLHFGFGTMAIGRENVAQVIGAKMAVSFRGYDYYVFPMKNKDCYHTLFSKDVRYHVLSNGMKNGLLNEGIVKEKIFQITPAIDIDLFKPLENIERNNTIQITTISRLHYIKGIDYCLEALALLKQQGFDFHFSIIGEGNEKERLVFAAHQLGLQNQVSFLGKLPPEEVKKRLESTDVYLQYSIQEGFCNAVLEAQAMGLLCIVSDAEGLSENVLDKQTGFVVPKLNPQLLAEKIAFVLHLSKNEKVAIQNNAIERVRSEFNLEKQEEEFMQFYT